MGFYDIGWERMEHATLGWLKEHAKAKHFAFQIRSYCSKQNKPCRICSIHMKVFNIGQEQC